MSLDEPTKVSTVGPIRVSTTLGAPVRRRVGVLLLVGALLAPLALAQAGAAGQNADLNRVVVEGLDLIYSVSVVAPGSKASTVSDGEVNDHARRVPELLRPVFTGKALGQMSEALGRAFADHIKAGVRDVAGGARDVEILAVETSDADAKVLARAVAWLDTEPIDPDSDVEAMHTETTYLYDLHLVRTPAGWRIDRWDVLPE